MYTIVQRRGINSARLHETMQRAQSEFFPKLQQAAGLTSFSIVTDATNGIQTAIVVWETKAQADAFEKENSDWMRTLEEMGHTLHTDNRGETVVSLAPHTAAVTR